MTLKVGIFGSCVSRDAFTLAPTPGLGVGAYVARSSMASAFHEKCVPPEFLPFLDRLESPFQRRMVELDFSKRAAEQFSDPAVPVVVDLIDERFRLVELGDSIATWSGEFSKLEIPLEMVGRVIVPGSDEHWSLWTRGARRFIELIGPDRIILNAASWAGEDDVGEPLSSPGVTANSSSRLVRMYEFLRELRWRGGTSYPQRLTSTGREHGRVSAFDVANSNLMLVRMYRYLRELGLRREISYPCHLIRADRHHKWGVSPFHYAAPFYSHTMQSLERELCRDRDGKEVLSHAISVHSEMHRNLPEVWCPPAEFLPLDARELKQADGRLCLPLHNAMSFEVDDLDAIDWNPTFDSQHASSVMWLTSLVTAGRLLSGACKDASGATYAAARRILVSFMDHIADAKNRARVFGIPSSDHAAATRTSVFVRFLQICREAKEPEPLMPRVLDELQRHVDWLCEPSHHPSNNHGLMMDRALLLAAAQLRGLEPRADDNARLAVRRVMEIATQMFDGDGYSFENTVGYHNFNIKLFRGIQDIARKNGFDFDELHQLDALLEKATDALAHCIWPSGEIPPIGDSPVYRAPIPSKNESKWFRESHFVVVKNQEFYLSLVCGHRFTGHKQVDDSSITLRFRDRDIIVDGGSYNYDMADPVRLCLQSARGHSGIYPDEADATLPPYRVRNFPFSAQIDNFEENADFARIDSSYTFRRFDGSLVNVSRRVVVLWPGTVVIADTVDASDEVSARQSFVFSPKARLSIKEAGAMIESGEVTAKMLHYSPSVPDWFHGETSPAYRGWYSEVQGKAEATSGVDFRQSGVGMRFLTTFVLCEPSMIDSAAWAAALDDEHLKR